MSLTDIQKQVLQPFIEETLENLSSMAEMNGSVEPGFSDQPEQFRFKGYAICCETSGHIEGVILMHHYPETALAMGNSIRRCVLGDEEIFDSMTEDMSDALAEWGNTVVGRATRCLGESNLGIKFDAPYFVHNTDEMSSVLTGVKDIITVPVHIENVGRFYFNYLIRNINQEACRGLATDKKILIVDDLKMVRTSIKRYLGKLGYENICEAVNGLDAIEKFDSEHPDFLFMDVVMPELNGNEALRKIRAKDKDTPIVMLSSVADQQVINECESLGINGYIVKPLTMVDGPEMLGQFLS